MAKQRTKRENQPNQLTTQQPGAQEIELAKRCGVIGLNPLEFEAKMGGLSDQALIKAYQEGKAQHAFDVMHAIYLGAMVGKEKLLLWLAENNLKRNIDAKVGDAIIDSMTPEQRREKIKELTRKLQVG